MIKSVLEVLEPLDESNEFAIIGYQGNPSPVLWNYPDGTGLIQATPENLETARAFTESLARRFSGSTPTHYALMSAMQYSAKSIILMSDGEPDNSPAFIIQDIASLNRFERKEIHTVAIGDYTQNRGLVMFLQELARAEWRGLRGSVPMRMRRRNFEIYSLSAVDLFASAMGAFIIITIILMPDYQKEVRSQGDLEFLEELAGKTQALLKES